MHWHANTLAWKLALAIVLAGWVAAAPLRWARRGPLALFRLAATGQPVGESGQAVSATPAGAGSIRRLRPRSG